MEVNDAECALAQKLGGVLHARAHRHGLGGGGIDCFDADLALGHAPCYVIAAELIDFIPTASIHPGRDLERGRTDGGVAVARHFERWLSDLDVTGPDGRECRDRMLAKAEAVGRRLRSHDPQWWRDEKFGPTR